MINKIDRFERKWIYNKNDNLTLINSLMRSKLFFNFHYPSRKVNSIYFDTNNYSSIRQNLDGISEKKKIRVRWYGDKDLKKTDGQFELKFKNNKLGSKKTHLISFKDSLTKGSVFNHNTLRRLITSQLDNYSALIFKEYDLPVLYNNYHRKYFTSSDNLIRVTVDTNYGFNVQNTPPDICTDTLLRLDIVIIEFKFSNNMRAKASQVLHGFPVRASRHSKYVSSIGMLYDT